jgi:hypothetical protein
MRKSVKRVLTIVTAIAVTGGAVAAYAAWNATGSGNATAQAGTAQELQITQVSTAATLYPGATGDSTIRIENPNSYPVDVTKISWTPADGVAATPVAGSVCNNTGVYFGDFSMNDRGSEGVLSGLSLSLGAHETKTFTLAKSVRMINNSENGCQGATFSIPVKVSGVSAAS